MDGIRDSMCAICKTNQQKYRCPMCRIVYCSVTCYKHHKAEDSCAKKEEGHAKPAGKEHSTDSSREREDGEVSSEDSDPEADADRLKPWQLQSLGKSDALKSLLQNRHLREMIIHLDQAEDKVKAIEGAMQEPIFVEFADACLSATQSSKESPLMER
ncbi:zinc finger HIT domain-containing protein 3-like [Diadema antillarum]|uniref:zinc finger HIT domain-containing protein 3-like n=1 Tax=Diadema antillarum TaxID=105358 RepID=UPI003A899FA3